MGVLKGVVKVLVWPWLHLLYFLSGFVPRDRRLWACGSFLGRRMGDNPKWFFLEAVRRAGVEARVVWVTRDRQTLEAGQREGLPIVSSRSLRGIWVQLRARVYVVEQNIWDVGYWFSRRAVQVNVWHGIPLKQINLKMDDPDHALYRAHRGTRWQRATTAVTHPWARLKADLMVATNDYVAGLMAGAFEIPDERVLRTGLPRNDALLAPDAAPLEAERPLVDRVAHWRRTGRRVLFYMPTYRDHELRTEHGFPIRWDELNALLERCGAELLMKIHPTDDAQVPRDPAHGRLHVLGRFADPYPLLRHTDVLITDYSSVLFDFLLLDRPIVFFAYDLESYTKRDRPMYVEYEEVACGPVARGFEDLLTILDDLLGGDPVADGYADHRARVRRRYHDDIDGRSSRRLADALRRRLA